MLNAVSTTARQRAVCVSVALGLFVLGASGCAPTPPRVTPATAARTETATPAYRIERFPKVEGQYQRLGNEQVQIGPYRMARIDHEDADAIYVRVYEPVEVRPESKLVLALPVAGLQRSTHLQLQAFDQGLPRQGQWRNDLTVADLDGDGKFDLASTPPRKSLGRPVIFRGDGKGQWHRWHEAQFPELGYDYGGITHGDLDGDGRVDLALGMHLRGFTVLRQGRPGQFERADLGLPALEQFAEHGYSGTEPVWSADANKRPLLVLLDEQMRSGSATSPSRTAHVFAWQDQRWVRSQDAPKALDTGGRARLVSADRSAPGQWLLLQSSTGLSLLRLLQGAWTTQALTVPEGCELHAIAVADVDADRQPDFAVSCLRLIETQWWSQVELLRSRLGPLTLQAGRSEAVVSNLRFFQSDSAGTGPDLALLDRLGGLQLLVADGSGGFTEDHFEPAPDWRAGCPGYALHAVDLDQDRREDLVASFAGESSAFETGPGCRDNGGISAWKMVRATGS